MHDKDKLLARVEELVAAYLEGAIMASEVADQMALALEVYHGQ
jgi:hypothetical protein